MSNTPKQANAVLDAAIGLSQLGWPVIPLSGKKPIPRDWPNTASTNPVAIEAWWEENPQANVGIVTGPRSGLLVIDIDPRNGGKETLRQLEDHHGPLPGSVRVRTGSGGFHIYLKCPDPPVKSCANALGPGVDTKCKGGQVVAPPSIHPETGKPYAWIVEHSPDDAQIEPAPPWLLDLLVGPPAPRQRDADGPIRAGTRNDTLTSLAGTMRRRGMSEEAIEAALLVEKERCNPPLPVQDVTAIARSVSRYKPGSKKSAEYMLTDTGNGERIVAEHGQNLRFIHPWKKWLVWNEQRWMVDERGEVQRLAKATVRHIYHEAAQIADAELRKATAAWARTSEKAERRSAMITLATYENGIALLPGEIDADPWSLNVPNGTIDLRTGELRPHRRKDLITSLVPTPYDPDAPAPRWNLFLDEILASRADIRTFLRRFFGYCLTGDIREEALLFAIGRGCNGKTKFHEAIRHTLGADHCATAPPGLLLVQKGDRHPTELKRLFRKRIVFSSEVPKGSTFNEERLKALTGGDTISARGMREDFFDFTPTHKLIVYGNDLPRVRDASEGFWRRFRIVPFDVSFKGREDKGLAQKLRAERAGILAWMVQGCLEWQREGLGAPVDMARATTEYRAAEDTFGRFLEDYETEGLTVSAADLYSRFRRWAEENGERSLSQTALGRELSSRGWTRGRQGGMTKWTPPHLPAQGLQGSQDWSG